MTDKTIAGKTFTREAQIKNAIGEDRTIEIAFSSEDPCERWFGAEVLSHESGACDLGRLNDRANVLFNHRWGDVLGVVESARIDDDNVGRAVIRLGKDERGQWAFDQIQDGILTKVSVGYEINATKTDTREGQTDLVTVTKWMPLEISMVTVPADATVGVGRSLPTDTAEPTPLDQTATPHENTRNAPEGANTEDTTMPQDTQTTPAQPIDHDAIRQEAMNTERARIAEIREIGGQMRGFDVETHIANGTPVDEVRKAALQYGANTRTAPIDTQTTPSAEIGLTGAERKNFSVLNLIRALTNPGDQGLREAAAFELEASRAAGGGGGNTAIIPADIVGTRAALNSGTDGASTGATGGHLIGTDHRPQDMISLIYQQSFALQNANFLDGLIGDVDIPLELALPTAQWIGEDEKADDTAGIYGNVLFSPHTLSAKGGITRRMLKQTSVGMENLVRRALARAVARKADQTYFYGVKSETTPGGLAHVDGMPIHDIQGNPTHEDMVKMEELIADYTVENSGRRYMLSRQFVQKLKLAKIDTGSGKFAFEDGKVNEYTARVYDNIKPEHAFFGDPNHTYVGMWGQGLEIQVNDPREGTGTIPITIFSDMDFKFPHTQTMVMAKIA